MDFEKSIQYWIKATRNRIDALQQQVLAVERIFGKSDQTIVGLAILDGDSHNMGYQPLLIKTASNYGRKKYVYKSVDPMAHKLLQTTCQWVSERLRCTPFMNEVLFDTGNSYLREYQSSESILSVTEIERYFHGYGIMTALANYLEMVDLHFENVIATSSGPKIVDAEFALSATQAKGSKWSYKNSGLFESTTSPLCQRSWHSFIQPEFVLCGTKPQFKFTKNCKKDEHLIKDVAGTTINPNDYLHLATAGALAADEVIKRDPVGVLHAIQEVANVEHDIRCWLRPTAYYRILQLQLWVPNPKRLDKRIDITRNKLRAHKGIGREFRTRFLQEVTELEMQDLIDGDIPYFLVNGNDGSLNHHRGVVAKDFAVPTASALEICHRRYLSRTPARIFPRIPFQMNSISGSRGLPSV